MTYDPNTKVNRMKVHLQKLKFFLRPKVFNEISEFTIACLKKLDLKKGQEKETAIAENDDSDPMNDSFLNPQKGTADDRGTTSRIDFKMQESILILERREFQKKAAVLKLGVNVKMTGHDARAIERRISGQKLKHTGSNKARYRPVLEMDLKIDQMTPYIVNVNDLETTKFKQAKKRVLINPFDFTMQMTTHIAQAQAPQQRNNTQLLDPTRVIVTQKKPVVKFKTRNTIESGLSQIFA